jgi:hypothetical protein
MKKTVFMAVMLISVFLISSCAGIGSTTSENHEVTTDRPYITSTSGQTTTTLPETTTSITSTTTVEPTTTESTPTTTIAPTETYVLAPLEALDKVTYDK